MSLIEHVVKLILNDKIIDNDISITYNTTYTQPYCYTYRKGGLVLGAGARAGRPARSGANLALVAVAETGESV